jgi:uncharacterized SAM-binding protein YcdF (DUF218 family)
MSAKIRSTAWGTLNRRERWSLSARGWLVMFLLSSSAAAVVFFQVHSFLAVTHRVTTDVLVVEGWIDLNAMGAAVDEFRNGGYRRVLTTGGPVHGFGEYSNDYNTSASVAVGQLEKAGLSRDRVQMVPSRVRDRDRTYHAAVALREWLQKNEPQVTRINVLTEGVHARRSRLLFQKALDNKFEVGIVSVPNTEYDADRWWRYSEGVKEIISEGAAYLYVRLFFHPD